MSFEPIRRNISRPWAQICVNIRSAHTSNYRACHFCRTALTVCVLRSPTEETAHATRPRPPSKLAAVENQPLNPAQRRPGTRLALTRHGQTDWNAAKRLQGATDIPLNDIGRRQAVEQAGRFDAADWDGVVSSPLSRAAETAAVIARELGIPLDGTYPDLIERAYGEGEGMVDEVALARWGDGGIPGEEPREAVAERGLKALQQITRDYPGSSLIVVAHGTLIREVLRRLTDADIPPILNAATSVIEYSGGEWNVMSVNDQVLV